MLEVFLQVKVAEPTDQIDRRERVDNKVGVGTPQEAVGRGQGPAARRCGGKGGIAPLAKDEAADLEAAGLRVVEPEPGAKLAAGKRAVVIEGVRPKAADRGRDVGGTPPTSSNSRPRYRPRAYRCTLRPPRRRRRWSQTGDPRPGRPAPTALHEVVAIRHPAHARAIAHCLIIFASPRILPRGDRLAAVPAASALRPIVLGRSDCSLCSGIGRMRESQKLNGTTPTISTTGVTGRGLKWRAGSVSWRAGSMHDRSVRA